MSLFVLQRIAETPRSTWGNILGPDGKHLGLILERGLDKEEGHPRIPAGTYKILLRPNGQSEFDKTLSAIIPGYNGIPLLCDVPGRSGIEIHPANLVSQLLGCLATASTIVRDGQGDFMATASRAAYAPVYSALLDSLAHGNITLAVKDIEPAVIA